MATGISFMLRAHNEEATLEESIRSLSQLSVSHEIVVILHCCTDGSRGIVERLAAENSHIRILEYTHKISRAGYENLATDADSVHSMAYYTTWCRNQCSRPWVFKWDADFNASPKLIEFINAQDWSAGPPKYYKIAARCDDYTNVELYCCCGLMMYYKYLFWEVPYYSPGEVIELDHDIYIYHNSSLTNVKSYWKASPWFMAESSEEAKLVRERVERLISDYGPEPEGMARAGNPECTAINREMVNRVPDYVNFSS